MSQTPDPLLVTVGADADLSSTDIQFGGQGDVLMVAGVDQYHQRLARLLTMSPGDLLGYPSLGGGFATALGQPLTDVLETTLLANARTTIQSDALTESVVSLALSQDTQDDLILDATVQLAGGATIPLTLTFSAPHIPPPPVVVIGPPPPLV